MAVEIKPTKELTPSIYRALREYQKALISNAKKESMNKPA